jgi:hypothetical protein
MEYATPMPGEPVITAAIRAAADRVLKQHGLEARSFALRCLRSSQDAGERDEVDAWRAIIVLLDQKAERATKQANRDAAV